jgi:ferredoxin
MATQKVEVLDTCIACQTCCEMAPGSFKMGDDNLAHFIDPPADTQEIVLQAAQSCPVDAIIVTVDGQKVWPA